MRDILADGIAINDQEYVLGATGIAAPLRDHDGAVVAALNLGTLTMRYQLRRDEIIAAVKDAADRISRRFGYRGYV